MKVILFIDSLGPGGAQRQMVGLAIMLKQHGFDVKVSTYYDLNFYKENLDKSSVSNEVIPKAANKKRRIFIVYNYLKKEKPDWVIAYQETPSLVACLAKIFGCKFKLLVSERNTTQRTDIKTAIRFQLFHIANSIVPNSYAQENYLKQHHSWMSKKVTTITNFVDLERFQFIEHEKRDVPQILVVATLFESKNGYGLIEAANILRKQGYKFKIDWYGKVPEYSSYINKCQTMIDEYNLHDYFILHDKTKTIHEKYKSCDFLCLPSFYEGTPNVICEAMASGRPVICSNICDNALYIHEGKNGFLFNPDKPQSIALAISKALRLLPSEYQTYCKFNRSIAEKTLSIGSFISKYIQIISRC